MSDICGRDITPDAGTTLRKIKKMELEDFMDQFESISGNFLSASFFVGTFTRFVFRGQSVFLSKVGSFMVFDWR